MTKMTNEVHVIVEWTDADYTAISNHLEHVFNKSFSGCGISMFDDIGDATFYVKEKQLNSFLVLLRDEMEYLRKSNKKMKYRFGKTSDFYTDDGSRVQNSAPLA